eukprot:SAG31_NODE_1058_length_10121_cov_14.446617_9_plen_263_part_00
MSVHVREEPSQAGRGQCAELTRRVIIAHVAAIALVVPPVVRGGVPLADWSGGVRHLSAAAVAGDAHDRNQRPIVAEDSQVRLNKDGPALVNDHTKLPFEPVDRMEGDQRGARAGKLGRAFGRRQPGAVERLARCARARAPAAGGADQRTHQLRSIGEYNRVARGAGVEHHLRTVPRPRHAGEPQRQAGVLLQHEGAGGRGAELCRDAGVVVHQPSSASKGGRRRWRHIQGHHVAPDTLAAARRKSNWVDSVRALAAGRGHRS